MIREHEEGYLLLRKQVFSPIPGRIINGRRRSEPNPSRMKTSKVQTYGAPKPYTAYNCNLAVFVQLLKHFVGL